MKKTNSNLLGDLLWSMLQCEIPKSQLEDAVFVAIGNEGTGLDSVRSHSTENCMEFDFNVDKKHEGDVASRIQQLYRSCCESDWAEGRSVQFRIYELKEKLDNGRNQQTTTSDSQ